MDLVVYRGSPLGQEARALPAGQYNIARSVQMRSPRGLAFVPIRSMQVLAIIDAEEFVFVHAVEKQRAMTVWRDFNPQLRTSLDEPVPYLAMYYRDDARELQGHLQSELFKAAQSLAAKARTNEPARILAFGRIGEP